MAMLCPIYTETISNAHTHNYINKDLKHREKKKEMTSANLKNSNYEIQIQKEAKDSNQSYEANFPDIGT